MSTAPVGAVAEGVPGEWHVIMLARPHLECHGCLGKEWFGLVHPSAASRRGIPITGRPLVVRNMEGQPGAGQAHRVRTRQHPRHSTIQHSPRYTRQQSRAALCARTVDSCHILSQQWPVQARQVQDLDCSTWAAISLYRQSATTKSAHSKFCFPCTQRGAPLRATLCCGPGRQHSTILPCWRKSYQHWRPDMEEPSSTHP